MYSIIQKIYEKNNKILKESIKKVLGGEDVSSLTIAIKEFTDILGKELFSEIVTQIENLVFEDTKRKNQYESVRFAQKSLITKNGKAKFERRYYKDNETGENVCLTDRIMGLEKGERIEEIDKAKEKIKKLEKELGVVTKYKPYMEHFKRMEELAQILKRRREKQGSLNLDLPETKIVLDENGFAIDVKKYELSFANEIIEQFMLTANETVAERFYWLEAPFIYRVHEVPEQEKIEELNKFLYNFGYKIKGSKDNIHPKAFAEVLEDIKGKEEERVISTLILRTLKVARYESQNKGHFGIASNYYCHFTWNRYKY